MKQCKNIKCNKEFNGPLHKFFCSTQCREYNSRLKREPADPSNSVECVICGLKMRNLSRHIKQTHKMTVEEYKEKFPGKSLRGQKIIHKKQCIGMSCNKEFEGHQNQYYCSLECRKYNEKLKKEPLDPSEYVECMVCGLKMKSLSFHIGALHNMTAKEYKTRFPGHVLNSKKTIKILSDRVSGDKNPAYNHGGRLSPFSKKFVKYENLEDSEINEKLNDIQSQKTKSLLENGNNSLTIEYYTNRGLSKKEAKRILSERQTTFSLEKCIEKYGEERGRQRWLERQEKWQATLNSKDPEEKERILQAKLCRDSSISKVEQEIYDILSTHVPELETQYKLQVDDNWYIFDYRYNNKLIEFNGDYWHCNPSTYEENYYHSQQQKTAKEIWNKDIHKTLGATENDFEVLTVWESEYKQNPENVIEKCLNHLSS